MWWHVIIVSCLAVIHSATIADQCRDKKFVSCGKDDVCIERWRVCDGHVDCADSSDETAECHRLTPICVAPAFRCAYGACIRGSARCDGQLDCADGSDERGCASLEQTTQGPTSCHAAERELCDGWPHCADGSDETRELCSGRPACPPASLRCAYGACVHALARCNGLRDCADGSDEVDCSETNGSKICVTPKIPPPHSRVSVLIPPDRSASITKWVLYSCERGYELATRRAYHACVDGRWIPPLPKDNVCRQSRQRGFWWNIFSR